MEHTRTPFILMIVIFVAAGVALLLKKPPLDPFPQKNTVPIASNTPGVAVDNNLVDIHLLSEIAEKTHDGNIFCAHEELGRSDGQEKHQSIRFIWGYCMEYYKKGNSLEKGSGMSVPMVLIISTKDGHESVVSHMIPGNGSFYEPDVRRLFPEAIQIRILTTDTDDYRDRLKRLELAVDQKKGTYYNNH